MLLSDLSIVLVKTRFPENIGMCARACANMGCPNIILVDPERYVWKKALPLATPQGEPVLDHLSVSRTLSDALAPFQSIFGTTARLGGWRRNILHPSEARTRICERLLQGEKVALVFGPEDRGLSNTEISFCHELVSIPTAEAHSLNLAQAVLLLLYECASAMRNETPRERHSSKTITNTELTLFLERFRHVLRRIDCLHGDNDDYFFQPWKRLFARARLRRSEYDALMGLCRQIIRLTSPEK